MLVVLTVLSLYAKTPSLDQFYDLRLTSIEHQGKTYIYTVENSSDGFKAESREKLLVTSGATVKGVIVGKTVYIIDERGKIKKLRRTIQFFKPPRPPFPAR